jgi:diguanylate cyclase (GGDEF)-like protein
MNLLNRKSGLKTKLSIVVTTAVLLVVTVLGFYFDGFLKKSFLHNTRVRMHHGYERLSNNLNTIERQLKEGIAHVKSDEKMIASIELINNYQDKNNYDVHLIDEEKKSISNLLLNRVKLSFNDDIALYGLNGELIAFVFREKEAYRLNYISYPDAQRKLYGRYENQREYAAGNVQIPLNISLQHKVYSATDQHIKDHRVSYRRLGNQIALRSHQSIIDRESAQIIGYIEMSRILDKGYFKDLSETLDINIQYSFDTTLEAQAGVLAENLDSQRLNILQTNQYYTTILKQDGIDVPIYYLASLNKVILNTLLNENRSQFLILLIFVAVSIMLLMHYVINRVLNRPLSELMKQIRKIECQDYTGSEPVSTGDELEDISVNINRLALTVQERETLLKISRDDLKYLSNHDVLTDLPNRRVFSLRLQHALDLAFRNQGRLAIFFLDLDQFKLINDTLGHDVGDDLLVQVSNRLIKHVRTADTLARIGGDEFNILVENAPDKTELVKLVEKYMLLFREPFHCSGREITVTASIGIALYPENGKDSVTLIKHADLAMYSSKDQGRNKYTFFSEELSADAEKRANLIRSLETAIESEQQFELHYQPKVLAGSHQIVSIEALLRWNSPDYGVVTPDKFIALAEETGLIVPIGQWVLQQACLDFVRLQEQGIQLQHVSINISNIQMNENKMLATIQQAIDRSGIKHEQIELEITESYISSDVEHVIHALQTLHNMGIGLAIDDFGTGYSSMNYLQKLPVTRLKIDKTFVEGINRSRESATIIRAIIGLAKSFGLAITAEGVEHEDQLVFLENEQCDELQGYYFSEPLCLDDFIIFYQSKLNAS